MPFTPKLPEGRELVKGVKSSYGTNSFDPQIVRNSVANSDLPSVSVIILNHNGESYVKSCLDSVLRSDYPNYEVIFVDNASVDSSVKMVRDRFGRHPIVNIVENDTNYGFAEGNNRGLKHASGEYAIFLNNDTEVKASWLKELVRVMESDRTIAIAQAKLLHLYDRRRLQVCGYMLTQDGSLVPRGAGEMDTGQYDFVTDVICATGTAMIVRRKLFENIGPFDSEYFAGDEDLDLCWRAWLTGCRVVFVPTSVVYHASGGTLRSQSLLEPRVRNWGENYYYYSSKNRLALLLKVLEPLSLAKILPVRLYMSVMESLWSDVNVSRPKHIILFGKAVVSVIKEFRNVLIKRHQFQDLRRIKDEKIFRRTMTRDTIFRRLASKKQIISLKEELGIPY